MLPTKLAFVDIETTGLRTRYDRIIEIGILRVQEGEITSTYSSLINPQTHLPSEIIRLTGITDQHLLSAPTFREIASDILEQLDDTVFVAHNVRFDYGFLKTEFKRLGTSFSPKHFCTVRLSRTLFPQERHHNLDRLIKRFQIPVQARHRALDDAQAIYTFYSKVQNIFSEELFTKAMKTVLKKPSLPVKLSAEIVDKLPEQPGVYIFYGPEPDILSGEAACERSETRVEGGSLVKLSNNKNQTIPLYIGKSINIKERVLSHFAGDIHSPLEMKIAQQVESIETLTTSGELGALFLESKLIKQMLPLFNRRLRQKRELVALKSSTNSDGYECVTMEVLEETPLTKLDTFLGFYNSRKQAKEYLAQLAKEYSLCEKLLGLEKTKTACFAHRLERCLGACINKEPKLAYNMRFEEAFALSKIRPWPFPGAILIEEKNILEETTDYFLVDKWCFISKTTVDIYGSVKTDHEEYEFNLDIYKILRQFLKAPKNMRRVKHLTKSEEQSLFTEDTYFYKES